jgi:hypothetical protein
VWSGSSFLLPSSQLVCAIYLSLFFTLGDLSPHLLTTAVHFCVSAHICLSLCANVDIQFSQGFVGFAGCSFVFPKLGLGKLLIQDYLGAFALTPLGFLY